MNSPIKNIAIVGGGTAGWLTACILAKQLNNASDTTTTITLIESADIPTVGVGEGTVPTMRQTLRMIGVNEAEFIRECDVTFKQSIKFVDWLHAPTSGNHHSYHHLFNYPHTPGFDLTPYWLLKKGDQAYANHVSFQASICDLNLSPKRITDREYAGNLEYAYHLDAGKFSKFLASHGRDKLGIHHQVLTIQDVILSADGSIEKLRSKEGQLISADFFVDCSGFASRLMGDALKIGFVSKAHQLLVDTAVAMQVPYADESKEIPPYTIATAHEAGWTWDIGLSKRRGVGYVYSSNHTSHDRAEEILRKYIGAESIDLTARRIPMNVGYREKFWHKNCVAIGLAAGFVEPLEATALLIVEATAKLLADKLPTTTKGMGYAEKTFNDISRYAWDKVIDFIKLHYYLSKRSDSQFWLDNVNPNSAPESLLEKLDYWQFNLPTQSDFSSKYEVFQLENYQYVLYGMEFMTDLNNISQRFPFSEIAAKEVTKLNKHAEQLQKNLPAHREIINKIKQYGISKI
ncbi:tryptophan halogenase family protein [uncultured Paraglaciecola sp.]|uniref:tryptophan halogenase family protein n=1 Tax=uncultured Paraglaciecola sp. TaxID=1765024 RepID=UPI0030D8E400|tara:strand:+ start:344509 stop:346059 length:1551 start_codon:yes stop_codon:yes gene_type:complete